MLGFGAKGVEEAVPIIKDYLEYSNNYSTCFDGWSGLGASAVLKALAQHPPPSFMEELSKIIHIDCSRWKSRRALQRAILDELELPRSVYDAFDRRDMEDDFSGTDESSRTEIEDFTAIINRSLIRYKCLVIFHNGSDDKVDLVDCGIPPKVFGTKILWTYRGRLRHLSPTRLREKMATSSDFIDSYSPESTSTWKVLLAEEAREIALYTRRHGVTAEVAKVCCMYLLSLIHQGGNVYNWTTHASNYWVCDGIVAGAQAWDIARALHQEIRLEDYSSNTVPKFGGELDAPPNRWIFVTPSNMEEKAQPWTTSLFLASQSASVWPLAQLPFHQLDQLHVLKICRCSFSFQSPPFYCCHSLRFLGLESCVDQQQSKEEDKDSKAVEVFQRLWVLDISYTDWELSFAQERDEETPTEIREVHIKKGKIWHNNFAWRKLRNLCKLCIVEPTCPWETGKKDEFKDMVNLELLELSRNSSIQVLPSMSGAIGLKTLILDGCVLLEHVGPEGLPPSLESFSFNAGSDPTRISKISLAGCVHLKSFLLRGAFPGLEELDLSDTLVRKVDLSSGLVQVIGLNKVILMGCKQLRALLWSQERSERRQLKVLRIDTHGRNEQTQQPNSDSSICSQHRNYDGYVIASDARITESLLIHGSWPKVLITDSLYLHLHNVPPSTSRSERPGSKDIIPKPCCYNNDASLESIPSNDVGEIPWPPPSERHVEVSEGIRLTDVVGRNGISAIRSIMVCLLHSLHVHDNSCMLAVNTKTLPGPGFFGCVDFGLRWCRVERCPKLQVVFLSYITGDYYAFPDMETIWASHLPMAGCIWSKGSLANQFSFHPVPRLQSIHIHNCPRLKFVLPFSTKVDLPSLETLHITHCGDLKQVFPWDDINEPRSQEHSGQASAAVKEFPKLKHVRLHDLPSLQEICESRMRAPMLESVELRGCWSLRRLPAVGRRSNGPAAIVRIERDCWEKLQWEGLDVGHHPSLYEPRFSCRYYRKQRLLRGTVLR